MTYKIDLSEYSVSEVAEMYAKSLITHSEFMAYLEEAKRDLLEQMKGA